MPVVLIQSVLRFRRIALLALAVAGILSTSILRAQDTRGSIVGRITDPSGALVVGAEVHATNIATGVSVVGKSNEAGNYALPYLLSGFYTVQAEISGFKKLVRENVQVRLRETVTVDLQMEMGNTTESIDVKAETPLLNTADVSLGQTIDSRQITELPTFGGSPLDFVSLSAGMINTTDLRMRKTTMIGAASSFSLDGSSGRNDFTVDGVPNTMSQAGAGGNSVAFQAPEMSVSEFKVQSAPFDASVGHTMGALVNVSTKSGTNELHGEAHYVMQNSALNAATIFQNRSGKKPPVYQDHRYGISSGGPVYIPHVYNGKNKTFWFYNWEGTKYVSPTTWIGGVPTAAERNGDFSDLLKLGANYQIYDPASTVLMSNGLYSRTPFPNNIIPASRVDPVAKKIFSYYPMPDQRGNADGSNNWYNISHDSYDGSSHLGRLDHEISPNHRIYLRLDSNYYSEYEVHRYNSPEDGVFNQRTINGVSLDDVYVFSPTFVMNVRYGLTSMTFDSARSSRGFDLSTLGFSSQFMGLITNKKATTFPDVENIDDLLPIGSLGWSSGDGPSSSLDHSLAANLTKIRGNHTFQFGADLRAYRVNAAIHPYEVSPYLTASSQYTSGPFSTSAAQPVGGGMAEFLLGIPEGGMDRAASYAAQTPYYGLYFQDNWKVTPKLTLTLGLRYELELPETERFNRSVTQFDVNATSPIAAQAMANYAANPIPGLPVDQFKVLGGLLFAGVNGNSRDFWQGSKNDFLPRIALAWQALPSTVIRAGYGIFYDTLGVNSSGYAPMQDGYEQWTPIQASLDNGLSYQATLANPFPNGLLAPAGSSGGLSTFLGQSISAFAPQGKRPYAQRWSFGFQRALAHQFLVDANYVGNRGTHLGVNKDLNALPAQYLSTSLVRDQATIDYLSQSFPNPFYGTNSIYGTTISRASILRPYPEFGSITVNEPVGYSFYNSLQLHAEKRFSHGYTFQASYTWSKTMGATSFLNPSDPAPYYSISSLDRPQRISVAATWEVPFGRGQSFGANLPKPVDFFAGGWRLGMVVNRQSGAPLQWGDAWTLFTGNSADVALPKDQRSVDHWFNTAGFNRNSGQQLADNIRYSAPAFSNLRQDGQARWDFSAVKAFPVTETVKLAYRAEFINAWNHPNLFAPNTNPYSGSFGQVTKQDVPRVIQMSLRFTF